jgi:hypothetical protein
MTCRPDPLLSLLDNEDIGSMGTGRKHKCS